MSNCLRIAVSIMSISTALLFLGCDGDANKKQSFDDFYMSLVDVYKGVGVSGAKTYDIGQKNPHQLVVVSYIGWLRHEIDGPDVDRGYNEQMPTEWRPKTLADTELVVCIKYDFVKVETCLYTGGNILHRKRIDLAVWLREALTGRIIAETRFLGGDPPSCPPLQKFSIGTSLEGTRPSMTDLQNWLQPYVE